MAGRDEHRDDTSGESFLHTFTPGNGPVEHYSKRRLVSFLTLHLLGFSAQIVALMNFAITKEPYFFSGILLPFLFSGAFCAHAAWHCDAPDNMGWQSLPLKNWPWPIAALLSVPFGFLQGVIVLLAFEEYYARGNAQQTMQVRPTANKFHCKAVNGMFEGFLSSALLLYSFWSLDFPKDDPITPVKWRHRVAEAVFLAILGIITFFQSGVGLMELDFCVSRAISKRMRRSLRYEFLHWLFRTCEVISRVSLFIGFMVITRQRLTWWWWPLAAEFFLTMVLVAIYGGAETTWLVRILCSFPCSFANIFLFIDSPYKRRAAYRLSRCLTIRNALEFLILPTLAVIFVPGLEKDLQAWWERHVTTNLISLCSVPMYWILLWWITSKKRHFNNIVDIFSACEEGSVAAVRSAIRDLTKSAAVGLNINCFDIEGKTPLMFAALKGHDTVCHLLLQEGARVDLPMFSNSRGQIGSGYRACFFISVRRRWTAMHLAAWKGHAEVVRVLLEGGSPEMHGRLAPETDEGSFFDTVGDTPLHVAAWSGHAQAARLLAVGHQEWISTQNGHGQTPVDLARTEDVRQAILSPTSGGEDGGRAVLLLQRPAVAEREEPQQGWPQMQLPILRISKYGQLAAPGLCSYVASSCGGVLGRVFLASTAAPERAALLPRLPSISEADETESVSTLAQQTPSLQSVPAGPLVEDLEPISSNGEPVGLLPLGPRRDDSEPGHRLGCCFCVLTLSSARTSMVGNSRYVDDSRRFQHVPDESVLGEGAYGVVWRARDRRTGTWYAIKNIKIHRRGTSAIATRECEVADHIRLQPHPCLVHLYHVHHFQDIGLYSLVMEFCPGGDLLDRIRAAKQEAMRQRRNYRPPREAHQWIGQVFLGLEHMHLRMETLLRDLKPENVVLDNTGRVKLTDFGFGRFGVESTGRWTFGIPTGSPGYVAPEILKRMEYNCSVDLYSFGVLVWMLLTGGLTTSQDPIPPMGRMQHRNDFEAHLEDWLLLAHCITNPDHNQALHLDEDAKDFVARMTDNRPESRLRHAQIRTHTFMRPLQLPPFEASCHEVEAWLNQVVGQGAPAVAA